jgi:hypothetical protein
VGTTYWVLQDSFCKISEIFVVLGGSKKCGFAKRRSEMALLVARWVLALLAPLRTACF